MTEEEEYQKLLSLGGQIGGLDAEVEKQKLLAKRMRAGIADLSPQAMQAGRVQGRASILQGIGNVAREYKGAQADNAIAAAGVTRNQAQQEQNQRVLAMILRKQAAAQGPTTGTRPASGMPDEDPYAQFRMGGSGNV